MKFSIITCTKNSEKYIKFCLDSIVFQSYKNFELIIIDGYSKDKTMEYIEEYRNVIPFSVFQIQPKGISNAMNFGIKKAKGEYVIYLHSDDKFYDNDVLKDVSNFFNKYSNLDWIYGKIDVIEKNGSRIGIFPERKLFQLSLGYLLKFSNYIPHQSVFIKKIILEKYGCFDDSLSSEMDLDLWLRIYSKTKWMFINRVISKYRMHNSAQSSGINNIAINKNNYYYVLKRYLNPVEFLFSYLIKELTSRIYQNVR
jgi:glycosyltransferase involved in cell wall biosynthesis